MPAAVKPATPWYRKGWVLAVGGVVVGFALGASAGGDTATENTASDVPTASETVTVTAEPTPQPVSEPSETQQAADGSQVGGTAGGGGDTFVIPDETGKSLQAAQDDLQAISGNPFFFSDSEDATGDDREAILDSGWQVCSQDPAPGTEVRDDEDDVVFFVVRVSENCP